MIKLKVLDTMSIDNGRTMVALQGTSKLDGFSYLLTSDGIKHKIVGRSTQSIKAYDNKIIDLLVNGTFDYSEAELV